MLIDLTLRCNEQCPHCFVNALPDSGHMSYETLYETINFVKKSKSNILIVSGGEITADPDFCKKIQKISFWLRGTDTKIILESNGVWIRRNSESMILSPEEDETNKKLRSDIKMLMSNPRIIAMQVSSHRDFYQHYNDIVAANNMGWFKEVSNKITVVIDWQGESTNLHYLGRAQNILDPNNLKGYPCCINLLLSSRQIDKIRIQCRLNNNLTDWETLIMYMEQIRHRFCTPSIDINGKVHVGETPYCMSIGDVSELNKHSGIMMSELIMSRMNSMKFCDKCKVAKNLDPNIRNKFNL